MANWAMVSSISRRRSHKSKTPTTSGAGTRTSDVVVSGPPPFQPAPSVGEELARVFRGMFKVNVDYFSWETSKEFHFL